MTGVELDTLKVIWAYMVEEGRITTGTWSYYGGHFDGINDTQDNIDRHHELMKQRIRDIGVDWAKMDMPEYELRSSFVGTFAEEQDTSHTLLGKIHLKDGTWHLLGVPDCDTFYTHFGEALKKMSASQKRVKDIFGDDE